MTVVEPGLELQVQVRPAVPGDAEGIVGVYRRAYGGGYPVRALTTAAGVRRLIASGRQDWILALAGDRVIGTILTRPDRTDGRYEICGAAVDPEHRGRARFNTMMLEVCTAVLGRPDCALVYCFVRTEGVRRGADWTRFGWRWTGTDGGLHRVGREREEHLLGLILNRSLPVTRVAPAHSVLVPGSDLADEVAGLGVPVRIGPYPDVVCARAATGGEYRHESGRGRVRYTVADDSRAVEVDAVDVDATGSAAPAAVRRLLAEIVDGAGPWPVEHLTINVLAGQRALIAELCRPDVSGPGRRFTAVGYRPAWHQEDGERYDCVTLAARLDGRVPRSPGLADRIEVVRAGLAP